MSISSRTNVYIDGFNIYYCAVKNTPYRWLNLLALCNNLFPNRNIKSIKYFTAKVKASMHDPDAPTRQEMYWRALRTIPSLEIIKGSFVRWPRLMPQFPLAYIDNNHSKPPNRVQVERTEEKGSDVNLASYLIYDSLTNDCDESVVITNDSDLAKPIEIITRKLNRTLIVVNPNRTKMARKWPRCKISKDLRDVATTCILSINEKVLDDSQFPTEMSDANGHFSKPKSW